MLIKMCNPLIFLSLRFLTESCNLLFDLWEFVTETTEDSTVNNFYRSADRTHGDWVLIPRRLGQKLRCLLHLHEQLVLEHFVRKLWEHHHFDNYILIVWHDIRSSRSKNFFRLFQRNNNCTEIIQKLYRSLLNRAGVPCTQKIFLPNQFHSSVW